MTLKQLQAEWRAKWSQSNNGLGAAVGLQCADSLAPHIVQQEADLELLRKLVGSIEDTGGHVESDNGCQYCEAYRAARSRLKEME